MTGKELFRLWADTAPWSSIGFGKDWDKLHPHLQAKWEELANILRNRIEWENKPTSTPQD